jgi:hypothetical protein
MAGVSTRRLIGAVLALMGLAVPFPLVAHAAERLVEPWSAKTVSLLLRVTAPLRAEDAAVLEPQADAFEAEPDGAVVEATGKARLTKGGARRWQKPSLGAKPTSALFVSQATVLKLAQTTARPQGSFVAETAEHPAGLRLVGVAALGIGVQDGDILIEALGITPRSPGQVIGAIIEARSHKAAALSGTLWRHGQLIRITVEQPYQV